MECETETYVDNSLEKLAHTIYRDFFSIEKNKKFHLIFFYFY